MALNIKDLAIRSLDFEPHAALREEHSGGKGNVMPRLVISGVPKETKELAVICHDPDAPLPRGFTHVVVYGIGPETKEIHGASDGWRMGPNGIGAEAYLGPAPPPGHGQHHYYFWVYALDTKVEGSPTREEFLQRYASNIIEQNRVVGTFELN
jgi:Raf kinase inhibitor-like YbhB/YbcL family protein